MFSLRCPSKAHLATIFPLWLLNAMTKREKNFSQKFLEMAQDSDEEANQDQQGSQKTLEI